LYKFSKVSALAYVLDKSHCKKDFGEIFDETKHKFSKSQCPGIWQHISNTLATHNKFSKVSCPSTCILLLTCILLQNFSKTSALVYLLHKGTV
jgi:hypothetical protein